MRINNNMMAMNTHRQLGVANNDGAKSMEKLSSGMRINRAGDDAAGLSISEKMRGQIRGLNQASSNAQDGISLIQTAEGALNETHAILQRMRELSVQASTDTNTASDRVNIQDEIDELTTEITRISENTEFNTMNLLDGSYSDKKIHIGSNEAQDMEFTVNNMGSKSLGLMGGKLKEVTVGDITVSAREGLAGEIGEINVGDDGDNTQFSVEKNKDGEVTINLATDSSGGITTNYEELASALEGLGLEAKIADGKDADAVTDGNIDIGGGADSAEEVAIDVSTQANASKGITTINNALENVSKERSKLGALQNRLEHTIKNLDTSSENLQASEARIRDVDMAKEMMEQTKQNILAQASTAMLANANQAPQSVLQLLG